MSAYRKSAPPPRVLSDTDLPKPTPSVWHRLCTWAVKGEVADKVVGAVIGCLVLTIVAAIPLGIYAVIENNKAMKSAPCSDFANSPAKEVPMRCLKCGSGIELAK